MACHTVPFELSPGQEGGKSTSLWEAAGVAILLQVPHVGLPIVHLWLPTNQ